MPETGKTPIQHYRTSTAAAVPLAGNMVDGEIAINTADKKIFAKNNVGTVVELAGTTNLGTAVVATNSRSITSSTGNDITVPVVTTTVAGFMSHTDKSKLDGVAAGATANVGTVTSVGVTAGTGISVSGSPVTTSGSITVTNSSPHIATNLTVTGGSTAGPIIVSSTGTNATIPTASATVSGAVVTGNQTWAGIKTFNASPIVPTATTGTQAINKNQLDAQVLPIATKAEAEAGSINTKVITPLRLREAFRATGTAPVFACRAWVNFDGTGTVAIRASENVSSITDNGVGNYTVNFTTAMPDANYSAVISGKKDNTTTTSNNNYTIFHPNSYTTSSVRIVVAISATGAVQDTALNNVAIFR